jgi:hypothetical protein
MSPFAFWFALCRRVTESEVQLLRVFHGNRAGINGASSDYSRFLGLARLSSYFKIVRSTHESLPSIRRTALRHFKIPSAVAH